MLIVFEGADCVGKSTLIAALREILGWPVLTPVRPSKLPPFLSKPERDALMTGQYRMYFDSHNGGAIDNALVDRCHLTNFTIGEVDWNQLAFCEDNIATDPGSDRRVVGVLLEAERDKHIDRMREKGESEELIARTEEINDLYTDVCSKTKIPFLRLKAYEDTDLLIWQIIHAYFPVFVKMGLAGIRNQIQSFNKFGDGGYR